VSGGQGQPVARATCCLTVLFGLPLLGFSKTIPPSTHTPDVHSRLPVVARTLRPWPSVAACHGLDSFRPCHSSWLRRLSPSGCRRFVSPCSRSWDSPRFGWGVGSMPRSLRLHREDAGAARVRFPTSSARSTTPSQLRPRASPASALRVSDTPALAGLTRLSSMRLHCPCTSSPR
jgi:hypothetical protein